VLLLALVLLALLVLLLVLVLLLLLRRCLLALQPRLRPSWVWIRPLLRTA
jgi:hypothetical protein